MFLFRPLDLFKRRKKTHREDVGPRHDPDQLRAAVDHRDPVHLVLQHQARGVGHARARARGDRRRAHRVAYRRARGAVLADNVLAAEHADEGLGPLGGDDGDARDLVLGRWDEVRVGFELLKILWWSRG